MQVDVEDDRTYRERREGPHLLKRTGFGCGMRHRLLSRCAIVRSTNVPQFVLDGSIRYSNVLLLCWIVTAGSGAVQTFSRSTNALSPD